MVSDNGGRLPFVGGDSVKLTGPRRSVFLLVALFVLSTLAAACDNTPVTPTSPAYSQSDLRVGSGAEAVDGSVVTVTYTGWFYDVAKTDNKGVVFDTTVGRDPLVFTVGTGAVISGWDKGVLGMKVGGARRLVLPPSYAYGYARYASAPPNATLIFDVELVGVQ